MNKFLLLIAALFSAFLAESQIVANKTSGCAPLTQVQFSYGQVGQWNFGDGSSATGDAVSHSYSNPGTYNVTFSVGGSLQDQITIQVFSNPVPAFSVSDSSGCVPFGTSFSDASNGGGGTAITQWSWAFGDGGGSASQNPNYTYSIVGTYSVSLIVTDANGCDSSVTKNNLISVTNSPTALFTTSPSPASACSAPLTVSFSNASKNSTGGTSNLTYNWDFGEGTTSTLAAPGPITYNAVGSYPVTLVVTEGGGCSRTYTRVVTIGSPTAIPSVPDTICLNAGLTLGNNSTGASSYKWTFSTGGTSSFKNPYHVFSTPGDMTIKLEALSTGCADDSTITVHVEQIVPDFTRNPTYLCEEPYCITFNGSANSSNIASWTYTFGNDSLSYSKDTTYCYPINDTLYYVHKPYFMNTTLNVVSTNGCKGSVNYTDTIYPVSAFFFPDVSQGCAPLSVNFLDSTRSRENIVSWEYNFGDGSTGNTQNPSHVYNNAGEYVVTLIATNSYGCKDTSYPVTIKVGEPLPLNFSLSSASVCVGESVDFTDLSNHPEIDYIHFETNNNLSADCINGSTHTYSGFDVVGTQDVTMTANYNGCLFSSTQSNALEVKGPKGELRYTAHCKNPLDYEFIGTIQGADTWHWDYGDGTIELNSVDSSPTHTYAASGDYVVKLITVNNSSGCPNDTAEIEVNVRQISAVITGDVDMCKGVGYNFSGATSTDVEGTCENAYWWDLGDQTVPRLRKDPTISFSFPDSGLYTIRLITRDINGCKDTTTQNVKVNQIEARIGVDKNSGCLPLVVNVSDSSKSDTTITKWFWFIEGTQYSTSKDNVLNVTTPGTKTLSLIAIDSLGCTDTAQVSIVPIIPDTNFSATTKTNICVGDSVRFAPSNSAALSSASWTFGNVLGTSTAINPYFTFNAPGRFDVKLDIVDTNGCPGSRRRVDYIYVEDYPDAGFSTNFDSVNVICYPVAIQFTDTSTGSVLSTRSWDLGTGNPIVPNQVVTWNYDLPGSYDIELIVTTQNGCKDTATKTVQVVGPIADFDMSKSLICSGEQIVFTIKDTNDVQTYEWDFGDGYLATEGSPVSHTYNDVPDGLSTIVQLIAYSEDSVCQVTKTYPLTFKSIAAFFDLSNDTICLNQTVTVTDQSVGADTYKWTISNGGSFTSATIPPLSFPAAGIHSVELVVENNAISCKDTLNKEILVHPLPQVFAFDTGYCDGDQIKLRANSPNTGLIISWTPATFVSQPNNFNTDVSISESSDFIITVVDTNNCVGSDVASITIQKQFDPISRDTCVVIGEPLTIGRDFGLAYTYEWTGTEEDKKWLSCLDCPTQQIKVTEEVGTLYYTLYYKDTLGCFSNEINYEVCIEPSYTFDVPTAFTPDGDGINDVIYLRGHGIKEVLEFKIFNRWGELVFESNELTRGWDGIYKERDQNMETYVYTATVEFYNGKTESKGGSITLIR